MKTVSEIRSHLTAELSTDLWFELTDREGYVPKNEKERAEILAELGFTPEQFKKIEQAFLYARDRIVEMVHADLADVWRRLDNLEKQLAK